MSDQYSDKTNMELAKAMLELAGYGSSGDAASLTQLGIGYATLAVAEAIQGLRSAQPVENMRSMLHAMEKRAATRDE